MFNKFIQKKYLVIFCIVLSFACSTKKQISLDIDGTNKVFTSVEAALKASHYNVKILNLSNKNLQGIPLAVWNFKYLKELYLDKNNIKSVSPKIAQLKDLEILSLHWNNLAKLPAEITYLKNLKYLVLTGNNIINSEQERLKNMLPNTIIYFD